MTGPCFMRLFVGISARELGFDPGRICERFLVNGVVVRQVFLRVLQFFPVNFSSRMMNFHNLHANIALRVNG